MNDVIEVWSSSGENWEVIACIVLEIQSLEALRIGYFRRTCFLEKTAETRCRDGSVQARQVIKRLYKQPHPYIFLFT